MMSTNVNKFSKVNIKTIFLIYGYVRIIDIENNIIPTSIINLLIKFYYAVSKIVAIVEDNNFEVEPPHIWIADINQDKSYQCKVKLLNNPSSIDHYYADTDCGICYIEDSVLPQCVFEMNNDLHPSNIYDVIFVAQQSSHICNGYIIDRPNNINKFVNAYYWKLPLFDEMIDRSFLVYSSKHGLISVGNDVNDKNLALLKFDNTIKTQFKWKWQYINTKWSDRCYISAAMLNDDKLIFCGGDDDYGKKSDLYDFVTQKMIQLAEMNEQRTCAGICVDDYAHNVYIGGGKESPSTFEGYDAVKNKWTLLCETNYDHAYWPIIWNDKANIIIIGSTDCRLFERIDIRENKWTDYIINDKTFDKLFGTDKVDGRLLMSAR